MEDYRKYLNKDAFKWDKKQLQKAVDRLGYALYNVSKRELKKFGYTINEALNMKVEDLKASPALRGIIHTIKESYDGDFKSGSLNRNQLLNKYTYINQAFQYTTLRKAGYERWVEAEKQHAFKEFGKDLPKDKIDLLWDMYHSFSSRYPDLYRTENYKSIKESITVFVKEQSSGDNFIPDDIQKDHTKFGEFMDEFKEFYEKRLREMYSIPIGDVWGR